MDRRDLEREHARRMRREARSLRKIDACAARAHLAYAAAEANLVIATRAMSEWARAASRCARALGAAAPTTPDARMTRVLVRHRVDVDALAGKDKRRALATAARRALVTAMTAAATAGTLDAADSASSSVGTSRARAVAILIESARKKKKKKGARLTKEWAAVGDDKTCEACDSVDGQVRNAYTGTFQDEDEKFDPVEGPPLHPSCRCALLIDWT